MPKEEEGDLGEKYGYTRGNSCPLLKKIRFFPESFDQVFNMFYLILRDMMFISRRESSIIQLGNPLSERLLKAYGLHDVQTIRYLRFMGHWYYANGSVLEAESVCEKALENPDGEKVTEIWEKLRRWHGEGKFTRQTEVSLCYDCSINWSAEKYLLYSTKVDDLVDQGSDGKDLKMAGG